MDPITTIIFVSAHLMIYSFLIGEQPIFRVAEDLLVGLSVGYQLVLAIFFVITACWTPMTGPEGKWFYIIPFVLGFLAYTQVSRKYGWLYRYPIAIVVGTGIGLTIRGTISAQILDQISSTIRLSLTGPDLFRNVSNFIMIVAAISSLAYFLFTRRSEVGPVKHVRRIGRYFLMIAFGAGFGSTAVYRGNLIIGRLYDLLALDVRIYTFVIGALLLLILAVLYKTGKATWQP